MKAFSVLLWGRQHFGQALSAHHTHTKDVPPPYPVQRQAFGGSWAGPTSISPLKLTLAVFRTSFAVVADEVRVEQSLVVHAANGRDELAMTDASSCTTGSFIALREGDH